MRVISGIYKGRRLQAPSWTGLRPTSDRLKETLFNILGGSVDGARVLDGYAGSGALGLEALSRGARWVTFVDTDERALELVRWNLAHCGVDGGYAMIRGGFIVAVPRLPAGQQFDLVLLDPPYAGGDLDEVLTAAGRCLTPGGVVVLEHARRREVPARAGTLARTRHVTAGDSALSFYGAAPGTGPAGVEDS
jgi:16S rRNA (guanine(966)-N(2))-methyltransferase RsmD